MNPLATVAVGLGFAFGGLLKLGREVERLERERAAALRLLVQREAQLTGAVRELERRQASERAAETERDIEARLEAESGD